MSRITRFHALAYIIEWRDDDGTYDEARPLDVAKDAVVVRTISVKPTDD